MGVLVDVVIGLVLTYLLVSLLCTVINELISSFFKIRAKELRKGIELIIDESDLREVLLKTGVFNMAGRASGTTGPSYIPSGTFALALFDALDPRQSAAEKRTFADIAAAIDKLQNSDVKSTLSALVRDAGDSVEAAKIAIARWFDEMMERLGGVYKRYMQSLSLVFAALLCIGLNVDTIQIGQALWYDEALRKSIAEGAVALVEDTDDVGELADIAVIAENLRPLPIGWDFSGPGWSSDWFRSFGGWLLKIVGLAFSALAVSLGAPFWFDLLQKFVRIRGSGKEPPALDESPSAGSADGKTASKN